MSSSAALFNEFLANQSQEDSFVMRMSASPFYPKVQDKLQNPASEVKLTLKDAIVNVRDN
jgi:hypothetical protein